MCLPFKQSFFLLDKFHPVDILKIAAKLGILNEEEVTKLGNPEEANKSALIKKVMENLGIEQQANILNHLQRTMNGYIHFQKYRNTKGQKLETYTTERDPFTLGDTALYTRNILLQDNGIASELVSKEKLVDLTVTQLKWQFAYSNEDNPRPTEVNNDRQAKMLFPGFMKSISTTDCPCLLKMPSRQSV